MKKLRICTNEEMRALDRLAETELGITPMLLMENAGRAAADMLLRRYPGAGVDSEILVFAGKGNNAGDAFVVARQLLGLGRKVRVFHLLKEERYKGATQENYQILKKLKAKMVFISEIGELESFFDQSRGPFVSVDGIIGTGLKGDLEGLFYEVIGLVNRHSSVIVSLDIPTGVNGDSGQVQGAAIQADLTVSFGFPRLGHLLPPGAGHCGEVVNVDISLPSQFSQSGDKFLLRAEDVAPLLKPRSRYAHKNTFGHVLLCGGSLGRTGAIAMAAEAALRTGAGLSTAATWTDAISLLTSQLSSELMTLAIPERERDFQKYRDQILQFSSIVVGPGMGTGRQDARAWIEWLLQEYQGPVVLDADALNLISEHKLHRLITFRKSPTVLTPHPGEMSRLTGLSKEAVVQKPIEALKLAVDQTHAVVMLKGASTLLYSPDEVMYVNHFPNSGMATAGSGDVLAGIVGSLLAQGLNGFSAAKAGVYLHSLSGAIAAEKKGTRGMLAGDIIRAIPFAYRRLEKALRNQSQFGERCDFPMEQIL